MAPVGGKGDDGGRRGRKREGGRGSGKRQGSEEKEGSEGKEVRDGKEVRREGGGERKRKAPWRHPWGAHGEPDWALHVLRMPSWEAIRNRRAPG